MEWTIRAPVWGCPLLLCTQSHLSYLNKNMALVDILSFPASSVFALSTEPFHLQTKMLQSPFLKSKPSLLPTLLQLLSGPWTPFSSRICDLLSPLHRLPLSLESLPFIHLVDMGSLYRRALCRHGGRLLLETGKTFVSEGFFCKDIALV